MAQTRRRLDELSIVVLSYNCRDELMRNLAPLCEWHIHTGFELIVVDNNSGDGTQNDLKALNARVPTLKVIYSDRNLGVAGGRNAGWNMASRGLILNLDDDTRIDLDAITALVTAARHFPRAGILTPKVVDAVTGGCQNDYGDDVVEPANFAGACHLVRADVWRLVGPLDPECNFGGEELDYAIRARSRGYSTIFLPNIRVHHNGGARSDRLGTWRRQEWVRNFSRIYFKHFPISHASILFARSLVSQIVSAVATGRLVIVPSLLRQAALGAIQGRRQYVPLSESALAFYRCSRLRPEFGNVPLTHKVLQRLSRQV